MRALKTIVHVEPRRRNCRVLKTSATPFSPPLVADNIGSTYFDLGAASYSQSVPGNPQYFVVAYLDLCSSLDCFLHLVPPSIAAACD